MDQRQETGDHKPQGPEPDRAVAQATGPWSLVSGPWSRAQRDRGFALLVTVTLLAFIVILLLGLAAYTRVETAAAGNTQRQAQARENALFALNIALGQLQKYAGPDQRVTATAETFTPAPAEEGEAPPGVNAQKLRYTGVWHTDLAATADPKTPLAWLVSGIEAKQDDDPLDDVSQAIPAARRAVLVGARTDGSATASNAVAALQDITSTGVPGVSPAAPAATIGRYAWWIGDQGVKAPVAVHDPVSGVDFAPYDSADLRERIRQQIALGAGAADGNGAPVFEPRDTNNAPLVANQKITALNQIAFLRNASNTQLGLARVQQNFHTWSPNNYAVIANTKDGGLRQDLSLKPDLLGEAFAAWANYPAYMEKFAPDEPDPADASTDGNGSTSEPAEPAATTPAILPEYGADPIRRRYIMTSHLIADNGSHQVAPVLTYFLITFNVRTLPTPGGNPSSAVGPLEVRARWMLSLWNPYSSALVPENLRVEIARLPSSITVLNETAGREGPVGAPFSLQTAFGSPLRVNLPWTTTDSPDGIPREDRQSWLPGRVYTWRSVENTTRSATPPALGYDSQFYSQTLDDGGEGVVRPLNVGSVDGDDLCHLEVVGSDTLQVTLYAVRPDGDVRLAGFTSPQFVTSFTTATQAANRFGYQFSYVFRLGESIDTPEAPGTWLSTTMRDLRHRTLRSESFVVAENGNDPAQYGGSYKKILNPDRLLSRRTDSFSYNEDVPIFEFPRAPILSLGALQHFRLIGQRPFMIGNPWGADFRLNNIRLGELFDKFFFSGLVDGVTPRTTATGDLILPNPLMKPLRNADGTKPTIADVRETVTIPGTEATETTEATEPTPSPAAARSSKYFLQGGAFNLNSANSTAWAAVLRGVRFPTAEQSFSYLDASSETGTAEDSSRQTHQSANAHFFRFSQSAQETYKAEADAIDAEDPDNPVTPPPTHLFRQGLRMLSAAQTAALAERIVENVRKKHSDSGPFRSLEEFLSPLALFGASGTPTEEVPDPALGPARSLLQAAIEDAGINNAIAEFSSQWLTQADVMTALAPILFPRSDTFIIRAYGEAVNPATSATEGRAWCEAIVQRLPEYIDPSLPPEAMPSDFEPTVDSEDPEAEPTSTGAQQLNKALGRRFKVVSFRWLTRSDI